MRIQMHTTYQDCVFDLNNMSVPMKLCGEVSMSGKTSSSTRDDHSETLVILSYQAIFNLPIHSAAPKIRVMAQSH